MPVCLCAHVNIVLSFCLPHCDLPLSLQVAELFKKLGKKLSPAAVAQALGDMDADGNGEVSFPEFKDWWEKNGGAQMNLTLSQPKCGLDR